VSARPGRILKGLGGGSRPAILEALARRPDSARGLAERLSLSYVGVKTQCVAMERAGLIESSRRRKARGRPDLFYRVAAGARHIFPGGEGGVALSLLEEAAGMFGPQAPGKLLFLHFQKRAEAYHRRLMKVPAEERVAALVAARTVEGCLSRHEPGPPEYVIEGPSFLEPLFERYPEARGFEVSALEHALGRPVTRVADPHGEVRYLIGGP
jgi:predicted ArsR family transcriptional regulator